MNLRPTYLFLGFGLLLMTGFFIFISIMAGGKPLPQIYTLVAMTVMAFCLAYLQPQFKKEDERFQFIRQKSMFFSYFAFIGYYILLSATIQFDILTLTAMQVLNILVALMIITVFLSMVVLSKVY